jgi:hypothetical protein
MRKNPNFVEENRIGTFLISTPLLNGHPEDLLGALARCVVVRAEAMFCPAVVEYIAFSPDFEVVKAGAMPNRYELQGTRQGSGISFAFRKVG